MDGSIVERPVETVGVNMGVWVVLLVDRTGALVIAYAALNRNSGMEVQRIRKRTIKEHGFPIIFSVRVYPVARMQSYRLKARIVVNRIEHLRTHRIVGIWHQPRVGTCISKGKELYIGCGTRRSARK